MTLYNSVNFIMFIFISSIVDVNNCLSLFFVMLMYSSIIKSQIVCKSVLTSIVSLTLVKFVIVVASIVWVGSVSATTVLVIKWVLSAIYRCKEWITGRSVVDLRHIKWFSWSSMWKTPRFPFLFSEMTNVFIVFSQEDFKHKLEQCFLKFLHLSSFHECVCMHFNLPHIFNGPLREWDNGFMHSCERLILTSVISKGLGWHLNPSTYEVIFHPWFESVNFSLTKHWIIYAKVIVIVKIVLKDFSFHFFLLFLRFLLSYRLLSLRFRCSLRSI